MFLASLFICRLVRLTSPNMNLIIALGVIVFNSGVYLFTYPPISNDVLEVFCAVSQTVCFICMLYSVPIVHTPA